MRDLVHPEHLAHFVRDLVREKLDLTEILETYDEARGYPPYHPAMMTALLLDQVESILGRYPEEASADAN